MSDLFSTDADRQREGDHARLRAAGFAPYSGSGTPSGYWSRKETTGLIRIYRETEALLVLAAVEQHRAANPVAPEGGVS